MPDPNMTSPMPEPGSDDDLVDAELVPDSPPAAHVSAAPQEAMASPTPATPSGPPGEIYIIDSTAVPLMEQLRTSNPLVWPLYAPILAVSKLLRRRIASGSDDPNVESLEPFEVTEEALAADASAGVKAAVEQLRGEGFAPVLWHRIEDPIHAAVHRMVSLIKPGGGMVARVHEVAWSVMQPPKVQLFTECISKTTVGEFLWTTSARPDMPAPPSCQVERAVKASALEVAHRHAASLVAGAARPSAAIDHADAARALLDKHHALVRDFHLARGVFKPIAEADVKTVGPLIASHRALADQPFPQRVVYAEMNRQANASSGAAAAVAITVISVVLFFLIGRSKAPSGTFLALLVGVLFLHELGHYLAMKAFGYRDLKMFFIPMIGAAVSGKPMTATGWKRAIVALAGPVPGIALGIALGIASLFNDHPTLSLAAGLLLGINAVNLLPFPPLDGGHLVQITLSSRHFVADIVFRAFGLLALIGLAAATGDRFLFFICIVFAVSLLAAFKLGRIAQDIRESVDLTRTPPPANDALPVPPTLARRILPRIAAAFPVRSNRRAQATNALHIYQAIHARPPGALPSLAILGAQGGAVVLAAAMGLTMLAFKHPGFKQAFSAGLRTADHVRFDPADTTIKRGTGVSGVPAPPRITVVGHFTSARAARAHYDTVATALPEQGEVALIGQTVFLSLPAGQDDLRNQWVDQFTKATPQSAVNHEKARRTISLTIVMPSEAKAKEIEEQLLRQFSLPQSAQCIPPWQAVDPRSPEQRQAHDRARRTLQVIQNLEHDFSKNPQWLALNKTARDARRTGDTAAIERVSQEIKALMQKLEEERLAGIRADPANDPAVVNLHQELMSAYKDVGEKVDYAARHKQYAERMTQLCGPAERDGDHLAPQADALASDSGYVQRQGLILTIGYLSFRQPIHGLPALFTWLKGQGGSHFRYAMQIEGDLSIDEVEEMMDD